MATTKGSGRKLLDRMSPGRWAAVILTVLLVVFVVQNRISTSITLFWMDLTSPLWFTLAVVFVLGWVVGVLTNRKRSRA